MSRHPQATYLCQGRGVVGVFAAGGRRAAGVGGAAVPGHGLAGVVAHHAHAAAHHVGALGHAAMHARAGTGVDGCRGTTAWVTHVSRRPAESDG